MSFDPCNRLLKIHESIKIPTPKVGAHLGVCGFILTLSYTPGSMKWDSWASLLTCSFASLTLVTRLKLGLQQPTTRGGKKVKQPSMLK